MYFHYSLAFSGFPDTFQVELTNGNGTVFLKLRNNKTYARYSQDITHHYNLFLNSGPRGFPSDSLYQCLFQSFLHLEGKNVDSNVCIHLSEEDSGIAAAINGPIHVPNLIVKLHVNIAQVKTPLTFEFIIQYEDTSQLDRIEERMGDMQKCMLQMQSDMEPFFKKNTNIIMDLSNNSIIIDASNNTCKNNIILQKTF